MDEGTALSTIAADIDACDVAPSFSGRRYLVLAAAVGMQACLGATYAWSIFVDELRQITGVGQGQVQQTFMVFYMTFPVVMIASGLLLKRLGLRGCAVLGGIIFGCGWMVAGLGRHNLMFTILGVGLIGGIGVGMAYIVPIATCVLWFPRHKGLVTGIAVAGFGGGAAIVAQVAKHLMNDLGWSPFEVFTVLGACFALLVGLAGSAMRYPPGHEPHAALSQPVGGVLRTPLFWQLYFAMFTGLVAGFTINANLKQLYAGALITEGATAVGLFAIGNAAGRICWGLLFDRLGYCFCIRANLLAQALMVAAIPFVLHSTISLYVVALWCGFNYGGALVIYASTVAHTWGAERVGQLYGWLFSANILAAGAPPLAGLVFDHTQSFAWPMWVIAGLLLVALLAGPRPLTRRA